MLSVSRRFRLSFQCDKARAELSSQSFVSYSAATRLLQNPIALRKSGRDRRTNCITASSFGFSRSWPFFSVVNSFIGSSLSHTTQASLDEEDVIFNELSASIRNAPRSASKICADYVDKLCRTGNLSTAVRLLKFLQDKHVPVGANAYNVLLVAASEKNDIYLISQVFKDAVVSPESLPSTSYLNLARAFMRVNDCGQLLRFIEDVAEMTFPRMTVLNRIIFAFAECRQVDQALLIFGHIKSLECKPDLITYNIILDMFGRTGRVDDMLHEFASMKEAAISPDVISYNTLLNSLRKVGKVDMCAVYFKEMVDNGIAPDLLTYTAMIESSGRSGNIEESLRLFSEMKARQIRPSIYIYRSLINNLKKMGKLDWAMTLLEEMNSCLSDLAGPKDFKRNQRMKDLSKASCMADGIGFKP
ncbi:hypothetical protein FNV43_RR20231 [Rhamnella rubrinervis]|uniref:Pentatricopeptide repeat-containing protein n=1 Tax=Rhamnella rubrinervis TaxID=2594499 RepID=A0A8K0DZZ6_9ROSA|nr:hypothetical protein FNV43_RR20231 [Rhamnella rubrinervis]